MSFGQQGNRGGRGSLPKEGQGRLYRPRMPNDKSPTFTGRAMWQGQLVSISIWHNPEGPNQNTGELIPENFSVQMRPWQERQQGQGGFGGGQQQGYQNGGQQGFGFNQQPRQQAPQQQPPQQQGGFGGYGNQQGGYNPGSQGQAPQQGYSQGQQGGGQNNNQGGQSGQGGFGGPPRRGPHDDEIPF